MGGPLHGVRVLDVGSYVSGPYAGQMLADLGAEVIKVESPPAGDPFRHFGRPGTPVSPIFANCNRGKASVAPNLRQPAGRAALLRLVATSDVWLCNWRPGVADRLELGDDVLASANDRLIRVYVTGYGADGPMVSSPVFDTIVQATSGLTDALSKGDRPVVLPGFPVDKITAGMVVQACLAALYARERHGQGDRVDISMLATAAYNGFVELFANRTFVDGQPDDPRNYHAIGLRPLRTADGWLVLAPVSGSAIRQACEVVGHPEWAAELRAATTQSQLTASLFDRLESVLPDASTEEWLERFGANDVPAARCLTMDEHLAHPQVESQAIYRLVEWDGLGEVRIVRYPAVFGSYGALAATEAPPAVGVDHDRLLS